MSIQSLPTCPRLIEHESAWYSRLTVKVILDAPIFAAGFGNDSRQSRFHNLLRSRSSIDGDDEVSPLFRDVFLYHWKEESQHAIIDELEWRREHASLNAEQRDHAVDDLIELVAAIDGILQAQAEADVKYFCLNCDQPFTEDEISKLRSAMLKAYRWQYIITGVQDPRFTGILAELTTDAQMERIGAALSPIIQ